MEILEFRFKGVARIQVSMRLFLHEYSKCHFSNPSQIVLGKTLETIWVPANQLGKVLEHQAYSYWYNCDYTYIIQLVKSETSVISSSWLFRQSHCFLVEPDAWFNHCWDFTIKAPTIPLGCSFRPASNSPGCSTAAAKSLQSCPTLYDPIDGSPLGSPVPGILQARTLEGGCHFLLQCMKVKVKGKSLSRVRFLATLWTTAHQAPWSMGFSRQEYWSGVPLPSPGCSTNLL